MPRATMAALIARMRTLIGDPAGASQQFSDDAIQDALDRLRTEQRHVPLQPSPTFVPGGAVTYRDYYAGDEYWEDDVLLQDAAYNTLTPDVAEPIVGHWHFASQPVAFAARATGKTYDIYGSAADLLDSWAAGNALDFDFTNSKTSFARSQKFAALTALATTYRLRALARMTRASQTESMPGGGGGPAVTYPTYVEEFGW